MSYGLSFSPEFYMHDMDSSDGLNPDGTPYSVAAAIMAIPEDEWTELCREVFGCEPDYVDMDTVLQKIRETDTCGTLSVPVDVWIDAEGYFTVDVYDEDRRY